MSEHSFERVLIANRGEVARRLIRFYQQRGCETVSIFSEPDVDLPHVEEADYPVYLNGHSVASTYKDSRRVVNAAMDSGSDAIHPGHCFLAERTELQTMAAAANVAVLMDHRTLARVSDRAALRKVARELSIPLIPAERVPDEADGLTVAASLGVPLFVKAVHGNDMQRVEHLEDLPAAVAKVRAAAAVHTGSIEVYVERAVAGMRRVATTVVGDAHGTCVQLGHADGSLQLDYHVWVEEIGPAADDAMGRAAVALAQAVGLLGVGRVKWAVLPDGAFYLLGFNVRLTTSYDLYEAFQGVDLVGAHHDALVGRPLGWDQNDATAVEQAAVQVRLLHVDPATGARPEEQLERLFIPDVDGVEVNAGLEHPFSLSGETEPLLAKLTAVGPTRGAALVKLKTALDNVEVVGASTNLAGVLSLFDERGFWEGGLDTATFAGLVRGSPQG